MPSYYVFTMLILSVVQQSSTLLIHNNKLYRLLSKPVVDDSFFTDFNNTLDSLKIVGNSDGRNAGITNIGQTSVAGLKAMFVKALRGENVTWLVLGGSSSQGADLGVDSKAHTYYHALVNWWYKVMTPATGSHLRVRLGAIGGVQTNYMSFCWKEYIRDIQDIDLVTWEFNINDCFTPCYAKSLNRFVNSVLQYPSRPALLFLKFYKKASFHGDCMVETPSLMETQKTDALTKMLRQYEITDIDIMTIINNYHKLHPYAYLPISQCFITHHPSHLLHAQMGYALVDHVKMLFLKSTKTLDKTEKEASIYKSRSLQNTYPESECYTYILPHQDMTIMKSLFSLPVLWYRGYYKKVKQNWDQTEAVRYDVRGGYFANRPFASLALLLDEVVLRKPSNIYAVISHQTQGGEIEIVVKTMNGVERKTAMNCSRAVASSISTVVLMENVVGRAQVEFNDPFGKCLISGIIVEQQHSL